MSELVVHPAKSLQGSLTLPGDKSISHRAILLGALCRGTVRITNLLRSDDVGRSRKAMEDLGVSIRDEGEDVIVEGRGPEALRASPEPLDMGNSGTTTRLLMGILAGRPFETTLVGDESLSKRPMRRVTEPLQKMGASFKGEDHLPLTVHGRALKGIQYTLPVASAQVKSALLLAGLSAKGPTTVVEPFRTRDHTERMLRFLGVPVQGMGVSLTVQPGTLQAKDLDVPGDISSAAFFLVAAAIVPGSEVTVRGVGLNPARTGFLDVLRKMGASVTVAPAPDDGW
ncbi:MAG: 3-phosphoshikimate 1-carboxyvinyltransferase, partial [Candidatus Omnitrophica bacterium]|nr:3-phosphoshikimate 1-carboxyvinyltransferase [Candidatus Omnitrophota bacterium]